MPGLPRTCRCCATRDGCAYFKEDAGKLLVGWFEPVAKPWGMNGHPGVDSCFDTLPEDLRAYRAAAGSRDAPHARAAATPASSLFFNGPESFTPDDRYLLGESPEVRDLFVAAGFNSIGIQSAGGAGQGARRLDHRRPSADGPVGRRRPPRHAVPTQSPLPARSHGRNARPAVRDALAVPAAGDRSRRAPLAAARPAGGTRRVLRRSRRLGACRTGSRPRASSRSTHTATGGRTGSSTPPPSTTRCATPSACSTSRRSANSCSAGRGCAKRCSTASAPTTSPCRSASVVYTQWLNERGGIEADLTVTREAEDRFLIVTAAATRPATSPGCSGTSRRDARAVSGRCDLGPCRARRDGARRARELLQRAHRRGPVQRGLPVRHVAG